LLVRDIPGTFAAISNFYNMSTLHLFLKKQWYNMIACGNKREEYRACTEYWQSRLYKRKYDCVCFHLGYTSTTMTFFIESIKVGIGKSEWGAPAEEVYIISLGDKL